jgi:uncharacterized protein YukE
LNLEVEKSDRVSAVGAHLSRTNQRLEQMSCTMSAAFKSRLHQANQRLEQMAEAMSAILATLDSSHSGMTSQEQVAEEDVGEVHHTSIPTS